MSTTENYHICCCCLELVCLKSLWAEYEWMGQTEVYGDMLQECFNLKWPVNEKSREQICEVCITHLRNAVQFKNKVLESQAKIIALLVDVTQPVERDTKKLILEKSDIEDLKNEESEFEKRDDLHEDSLSDIEPTSKTENASGNRTKNGTRKQYERREKIELRKINYAKPRQNVCLILENSTILPFKSNKGYFNCLYCNKQYIGIDELKAHVNKFHENITVKTISKSILRPHDRIRADVSEIACKICKKDIENLELLVKHLTEEHGVNFDFKDKKPSDCIVGYNLSDGKFKCTICTEEFLFFKTLSKHMNVHSTDYVCHICGKCFLLPERLRAHSQSHEANAVKCEYCEKVCGTRQQLKSHIRYKHKKISFMCSLCNITFASYKLKIKHLKEIHNRALLNLNCKLCSKKFVTPNSLHSHMRNDHYKMPKEAKYGCNICGMMFKHKYTLLYHSIVHSGEKNHECTICHKKYAREKTLKEHVKIHLNDRRWSCAACNQAFVQKCSLKRHINVHHVDMELEQLIVYKKPDK